MGISKDSIESLKLKSKISDFILSSTTGKLRGNKGMALCPFHGEKTASMSFTDEENLFHCFGCKEGGDIFKYVQLINSVEFQESVEIVADKYAFSLKVSPLSNCCLFTSRINVVCDNIMPPPITLFQVILQIGEMVEEMIKSILKYLRPHPMDYLHIVHFS